jgi:hypothetical protein
VYQWELIQSAGGGGGTGGSSSGGLSISGPYLTDGANYWISGTGQQATLFNNSGFSFKQGNAAYSAIGKVGYITLPPGSTASDNFETNTSNQSIIATFNVNDLSNTSGVNSIVAVDLRNGSTGVECGLTGYGNTTPTGARLYMNQVTSAYAFQSNVATTGASVISNMITLKLSYLSQVTTCSVSTDGGNTYTTFVSQNGAVTGFLNSAPTAAAITVGAGGYGASIGILSWVTQ